MRYFLQAIQVMGIVTAGITRAAADGVITIEEMATLIKQVADAVGIEVEIEVPALAANKNSARLQVKKVRDIQIE